VSRPIGVSAIGSASLGGAVVPGLISVGQGYGGAAYGAIGYANSALIATTVTVSTQTIVAVGIGSAEAFGLPVFVPGPVTVVPIGIPGLGDINTLWDESVTPGTVDSTDTGSVVLGLRFTVLEDGYIVGARFYKSLANTGTHTATLWDTTGVFLTTGTFNSETASGWQEMRFASPWPSLRASGSWSPITHRPGTTRRMAGTSTGSTS
jgi:hypothetical protein